MVLATLEHFFNVVFVKYRNNEKQFQCQEPIWCKNNSVCHTGSSHSAKQFLKSSEKWEIKMMPEQLFVTSLNNFFVHLCSIALSAVTLGNVSIF